MKKYKKKEKTLKLGPYLSSQLSISRREIMSLLKEGRIKVNGNPVYSISKLIIINKDLVTVNSKKIIFRPEFYYYKFNKPKNVISTLADPEGRRDLKYYMSGVPQNIFPVGRLDRNTKGLILFTNDGEFANRVSHPGYHINKVYKVTLNKRIIRRDIERLLSGLILADGPVRFTNVDIVSDVSVIVTINEGRNRIVRRSFEQMNYEVKKLKRISIGDIQLQELKEGAFKRLTVNELRSLKRLLNML
ncbi:MAG: rRNA pseudouridine synthase [bacterium]|nr:rRNA pseudouridine synthase [bacterium]